MDIKNIATIGPDDQLVVLAGTERESEDFRLKVARPLGITAGRIVNARALYSFQGLRPRAGSTIYYVCIGSWATRTYADIAEILGALNRLKAIRVAPPIARGQ